MVRPKKEKEKENKTVHEDNPPQTYKTGYKSSVRQWLCKPKKFTAETLNWWGPPISWWSFENQFIWYALLKLRHSLPSLSVLLFLDALELTRSKFWVYFNISTYFIYLFIILGNFFSKTPTSNYLFYILFYLINHISLLLLLLLLLSS